MIDRIDLTGAKGPANKFDKTIQEAIDAFAEERIAQGVEAIGDLASMWKSAGLPVENFTELCEYIERQAVAKYGSEILRMKIRDGLQRAREKRNGTVIVH